MKIKTTIPLIAGLAVFALLLQGCATGLSFPSLRRWGRGHSYIQQGHDRLAAIYRTDAARLRKRAAFHTEMAERMRTYSADGTLRERESWIAHCQYLTKKYTEAAEAAEEMAKAHEQESAASKSR